MWRKFFFSFFLRGSRDWGSNINPPTEIFCSAGCVQYQPGRLSDVQEMINCCKIKSDRRATGGGGSPVKTRRYDQDESCCGLPAHSHVCPGTSRYKHARESVCEFWFVYGRCHLSVKYTPVSRDFPPNPLLFPRLAFFGLC